MDQQTPPVQAQPQPAAAPAVNTAPPAAAPAPKGSKKKLVLALLMVLVLALVLLGLGYFFLQNRNLNNQTAVVPVNNPTASPTPEVTVKNSSDLDKAINEVNSTTTSTMESELNAAVTESKNL